MIATINNAIAKKDNEKGFTLIELLVVILIIGVLAAIAIPAFLNQREGAWKSQVQSDIANATIAAETFGTNHNGSFTGLTVGALPADKANKNTLVGNGYNPTDGVTITIALGTPATTYTLTAKHANLGADEWVYDSATGKTVGPDGATGDDD